MIRFLTDVVWAVRKRRAELADARERRRIARAFNDRYTYRHQYEKTERRLPGSGMFGFTPKGGNRWMCPDCNAVHAPTECSVFSGLQYPACCSTRAGDRLSERIR